VTEAKAEVGLLDTSVFIARESGRAIAELPQRVALPVVAQDDDFDHIARACPGLSLIKV
jgi:hypothetical protein